MSNIVMISGGFDPCHLGHLEYIRAAAKLGKVVVLLNSDAWLKRKKGYALLDWDTRSEILREMRNVESVYEVDDTDDTVCQGIRNVAHVLKSVARAKGGNLLFAKGGDRTADNTPEQDVCSELGITCVFGVGGEKIASSSDIVRAARRKEPIPCVHEDVT
jgi:cytidyltransferase-like protein